MDAHFTINCIVTICSEDQDGAESARSALRRTCVELINAYPKTAKKLVLKFTVATSCRGVL